MADDALDELLTFDDALQVLGTSRPTLYRLLSSGDIRGLKVGIDDGPEEDVSTPPPPSTRYWHEIEVGSTPRLSRPGTPSGVDIS